MGKKKKDSKTKKKKKQKGYKVTKSGSYISDGKAYKSMFKKADGKLKIIELKISKKKTIKVKMKYDKKSRKVVLLNPVALETNKSGAIVYLNDTRSLYMELWDILRHYKMHKLITSKKKLNIEKMFQDYYKLEAKFIMQMQSVDFMFNKDKYVLKKDLKRKEKKEKKKNGKSSKSKTNSKSKKSKKSNRK